MCGKVLACAHRLCESALSAARICDCRILCSSGAPALCRLLAPAKPERHSTSRRGAVCCHARGGAWSCRLRIGLVSARRGSSEAARRSQVWSRFEFLCSIEAPTLFHHANACRLIPEDPSRVHARVNCYFTFVPAWRTACSTSPPSSSTSVRSLSQRQKFSVPPDFGRPRAHTDIRRPPPARLDYCVRFMQAPAVCGSTALRAVVQPAGSACLRGRC